MCVCVCCVVLPTIFFPFSVIFSYRLRRYFNSYDRRCRADVFCLSLLAGTCTQRSPRHNRRPLIIQHSTGKRSSNPVIFRRWPIKKRKRHSTPANITEIIYQSVKTRNGAIYGSSCEIYLLWLTVAVAYSVLYSDSTRTMNKKRPPDHTAARVSSIIILYCRGTYQTEPREWKGDNII